MQLCIVTMCSTKHTSRCNVNKMGRLKMHELKITVAKNNRHWKMTDEAVTEFRGLEYG